MLILAKLVEVLFYLADHDIPRAQLLRLRPLLQRNDRETDEQIYKLIRTYQPGNNAVRQQRELWIAESDLPVPERRTLALVVVVDRNGRDGARLNHVRDDVHTLRVANLEVKAFNHQATKNKFIQRKVSSYLVCPASEPIPLLPRGAAWRSWSCCPPSREPRARPAPRRTPTAFNVIKSRPQQSE